MTNRERMTNREKILDTLKDDREYYSGLGKSYLSSSDIGALLSNPKLFNTPREDNKNFMEGRYFHQLMIEPEKAKDTLFVDVSTTFTKVQKKPIQKTKSLNFFRDF